MGLIKSIFGSMIDNTVVSDAQKVLTVCRSYGPEERADLKVCTLIALATMASDSQLRGEQTIWSILDVMDSGRMLSDQELGQVSQYTLKLVTMQKEAHRSQSHTKDVDC